MTRKHYILLAAILHRAKDVTPHWVVDGIEAALADDNPRFDHRRFHQAVYKEGCSCEDCLAKVLTETV